MMHKASELKFKEGTTIEVTFKSGEIKEYDISLLFSKYPQMSALCDRDLFEAGKLYTYGIIWSDELDIDLETVYEDGITVGKKEFSCMDIVGDAVLHARAKAGMSQKELASLTGIDQSDISKIERGVANPSISTLDRIAKALGAKLTVDFLP